MNNPFSELEKIKSFLPGAAEALMGKKVREKKASAPAPAAAVPSADAVDASPRPLNEAEADKSVFLSAMDGVAPLKTPNRRMIPAAPRKIARKPLNEDGEVMRHLRDLIQGSADFDISFSDEFIEGHVKGLPEKLIRSLKDGILPVEDRLDLHGFSLTAAKEALSRFISESSFFGKKTVLVIHGRGLRSPGKTPVLKSNLEDLLLKSHIRKYILAFSSARPCDGGTGASYVLLRNPARKKNTRKKSVSGA
ncbi:MAG: Smr/MutS family protein [Deltaproteobacteria bacterium]|jgi:DNA-nicking Smr family endonuclease|nr:Smr/MutS family protein [Deltaproteobacteria bacterium]